MEREALRTKINRRGLSFEDALANRLPILVRGMGRIEHCAHAPGDKAVNAGDFRISVETTPGSESVGIAAEAKSRAGRLSVNQIRAELKRARDNRDCAAAVLIAEAAASLPDGIGFGQVSERDFYVAFDPEDGDETLLTCTLYMAKVVALASITPDAGSDVDLTAALREVSVIRGLLEQFSKIETCHSRIDKEVASARTLSADLKSDIVAALRPPRFHPLQLKNFTGGAVVAPLPLPFAPCRPPARARRGRNAVVREQRRGVTPANCR